MKGGKRKIGIGLGVGLLGAAALTLRFGRRRATHHRIPDAISPAIFSSRVAQTSHGEMLYHTSGTGDPLVFFHGFFLGASSYEWSKVYSHFAKNWEVIAPDLIGFGESERPALPMNADDYIECLAAFLRETTSQRPATIIASGLSAGMCLLLASRHPSLVARLVLFLPTNLKESAIWHALGFRSLSGLPGLSRFIYRNHLARDAFVRSWLAEEAFADPSRLTDETVTILTTCAQQYGAEHAVLGLLRGRLAFQLTNQLSSITAPTIVLWPEKAPRVASVEVLLSKIPHASFELMAGCGVMAALENPTLMSQTLTRVLSEPPSARSPSETPCSAI